MLIIAMSKKILDIIKPIHNFSLRVYAEGSSNGVTVTSALYGCDLMNAQCTVSSSTLNRRTQFISILTFSYNLNCMLEVYID